jgi:hypothetical protein
MGQRVCDLRRDAGSVGPGIVFASAEADDRMTPTARIPALFERPNVKVLLWLAAGIGLVIGIDTFLLHLRMDPLADVRAYYDAGARLNVGLPLYDQPATTNDPGFYRYPPLLALVFRPLALLPFETAAALWAAFLIGLLVATLVRSGLRNRWTWLAAGWLAAPIAWSLAVGQAQIAVTFLLVVGAPWAVAIAAHLKVFPILAAVYWLGRRDWTSLARLAAWVAGLTVLSFVFEPTGTLAYIGFLSLDQVGEVQNRSLFAVSPALFAIGLAVLAVLALAYARTRAGWPLALALVIFANPRLLMYQTSSLQAGTREPNRPSIDEDGPSARSPRLDSW